MKVFVCISDGGGMLFAKRRVSRDAAVISDTVNEVGDGVLFVTDYSASLFEGTGITAVSVSCPLESAGDGDSVFLEAKGISEYRDKISTLVIYRWNRKYPFDVKLDFDPKGEGMKLFDRVDFVGKSHEKITRERWVR